MSTITEQLLARTAALTPQEVAVIFGRNERTVRNWLNARQMPGHYIHGRWKLDPGELAVWWEAQQK